MAMIYVKTKQGRAAFFEGRAIPHDVFYPVPDTAYTRRLAEHWEDVEIGSGPTAAPKSPPQQAAPPKPATPQASPRPVAPPAANKETN